MTQIPLPSSPQAPRRARGLLLATVACVSAALVLGGCNRSSSETAPPAAAPVATGPTPAPEPAPETAPAQAVAAAPVAYTPPTEAQLYELVAPIALYADKLVAQVVAGATYPDQVTAAHEWLQQNTDLIAGPLANAANQQPWDPSIKSLTAFRPVLDQMASNLPWTTALGQAYYNDPDDVLNAVQVMRQRAKRAGQLKSTKQIRVATASAPANYVPDPNAPMVYGGPPIVEPPEQFITIEPAQPDVVYVPSYNPERIYGEPVAAYPGYVYSPQPYVAPGYSTAQVATVGALTFGAGIIVGSAQQRHDWGWNSWGMNWGRPDAHRRGPPQGRPPGYDRPAVVYNRSTYISRSETVVNNNLYNNGARARQMQAMQAQDRQQQAQLEQLRREQAQQGQALAAQQQEQARNQQQQQARQQQAQMNQQRQQQQEQQPQAQAQQQREQQEQEARQQQEQTRAQQAQAPQQSRQAQEEQRRQQARGQQEQQRQAQQTQQREQAQQQEQARRQQEAQAQQAQQQAQQRQQQEAQQRQQQEQARRQQEAQAQQACLL